MTARRPARRSPRRGHAGPCCGRWTPAPAPRMRGEQGHQALVKLVQSVGLPAGQAYGAERAPRPAGAGREVTPQAHLLGKPAWHPGTIRSIRARMLCTVSGTDASSASALASSVNGATASECRSASGAESSSCATLLWRAGRAAPAGRIEITGAVLLAITRVRRVSLRPPHRHVLRMPLPHGHLLELHEAPDFRHCKATSTPAAAGIEICRILRITIFLLLSVPTSYSDQANVPACGAPNRRPGRSALGQHARPQPRERCSRRPGDLHLRHPELGGYLRPNLIGEEAQEQPEVPGGAPRAAGAAPRDRRRRQARRPLAERVRQRPRFVRSVRCVQGQGAVRGSRRAQFGQVG
jgi:hypothetical protein